MHNGHRSSLTRRDMLKGLLYLGLSGGLVRLIAHFEQPLPPSGDSRKRYYLAPDDHTDLFWRADEAEYRDAFLEMLDYYLELADETEGDPVEHQSRWACDGSYWMWVYEQNRSPEEFERFLRRIKDGHISVPLNPLCVCLGGAPMEAVIRGMYYPGSIERKYGLRFRSAYMVENQTLPLGIISLWAGAGADYSWKGICRCDSLAGTYPIDIGEREHEIYWAEGVDGSRILMKWYSFHNHDSLGGYAEGRHPRDAILFAESDQEFLNRYPYDIVGIFGKGHDDLKTLTREFVDVAREMTNERRKVIVSNEVDFFEDFQANYGEQLPALSESYGNDWDLYCTQLAEVSACVKRSVEGLRTAECLATIVSLERPDFGKAYQQNAQATWMKLGLFWEHNFGMQYPITGEEGMRERVEWQREIAGDVHEYVSSLTDGGGAALSSMIRKESPFPCFYAFNSLSWTRTDIAEIPYDGDSEFHVFDLATNREAPSQLITNDGIRRIRVLAQEIPACGYRVYEVRPGAPGILPGTTPSAAGDLLENAFARLQVAGNGSIISWKDDSLAGDEVVRPVLGRAMNDLGGSGGNVEVLYSGPVSAALLATSSAPILHNSLIEVHRDLHRIEIRNQLLENFDASLTWGFGLNMDHMTVWHEEVGAILKAGLLEDGGHYASRNARYDWLTLNHFAAASSDEYTLVLSNADCYFMKLGESSAGSGGRLDTTTPMISVLAGGREGGSKRLDTGIPWQGGDSSFLQRFALRTFNDGSTAEAMKFALEHQNPLHTEWIKGGNEYPADLFCMFEFENHDVVAWAIKPAEDGIEAGIAMRMWNLSSEPQVVRVRSDRWAFKDVLLTSHIETPNGFLPVENGEARVALQPHQIITVLLRPEQPA